ncbi:hypothetical protein OF83DRAFT_1158542 [Amylostereum chailletii]|nr:hypothetical protein OF83DRAFT_1158542 [Amylostereum chailletii]
MHSVPRPFVTSCPRTTTTNKLHQHFNIHHLYAPTRARAPLLGSGTSPHSILPTFRHLFTMNARSPVPRHPTGLGHTHARQGLPTRHLVASPNVNFAQPLPSLNVTPRRCPTPPAIPRASASPAPPPTRVHTLQAPACPPLLSPSLRPPDRLPSPLSRDRPGHTGFVLSDAPSTIHGAFVCERLKRCPSPRPSWARPLGPRHHAAGRSRYTYYVQARGGCTIHLHPSIRPPSPLSPRST